MQIDFYANTIKILVMTEFSALSDTINNLFREYTFKNLKSQLIMRENYSCQLKGDYNYEGTFELTVLSSSEFILKLQDSSRILLDTNNKKITFLDSETPVCFYE